MRSGTLGGVAGVAGADAVRAALSWMRQAAGVVRTVVGAPDYDRYVAHVRGHHPECEPISRDEFMQQRMESRYSRPGSRCC
jgi:uncharacterized short protein YbdD (DUF466 family)